MTIHFPKDAPALRLLLLLTLATCTRPPAPTTSAPGPALLPHNPATFHADIERLIAAKDYRSATLLLRTADPAKQVQHDPAAYAAIGGVGIYLPGITAARYDPARDWFLPGTSDAVQDRAWQSAATDFALQYNRLRAQASPP